MLTAQVRALADQVEIMQLVAQYGPAVDSGSGAAAAALRTPRGWRISERVNASLDGTPGHREMLAPPRPGKEPISG
jgi:hypothetical protein